MEIVQVIIIVSCDMFPIQCISGIVSSFNCADDYLFTIHTHLNNKGCSYLKFGECIFF